VAKESTADARKATKNRSESVQDNLSREIKFYMFKAKNIKRQLDHMTGDNPQQFVDEICLSFLRNGEKDDIHEHVTKLGNFQKRIVHCQDKILQLAGVGEEWKRLSEIAEDVRKMTFWVEEIFCYAMVAYLEVDHMYHNSEFMYQGQN
jgi:hypothetical protein